MDRLDFTSRLRWPAVSGYLVVALFLALVISIQPCAASDLPERAILSGLHNDQQFVAGEEVRVEAEVTDDVFAAGWEVVFEGASAKNIIAAGHSLIFNDMRAQDVIAAGGGLEFGGEVADDMVAAVCPICPTASRRLHLRSESVIGDDARLAAGQMDLEGRIGGDLYAAARRITLSGQVEGNAELLAERIVLAPGARIGGNLIYRSESEVEISPGAAVGGEIRRLKMEQFERTYVEGPWAKVLMWIVFVLALIVLGIVLQLAVPGLIGGGVDAVRARTWASLGLGFALLVATPVAVLLLFATVIGIPLAIVAMAIYVAALALALTTIAYWIGGRIQRLSGQQSGHITVTQRLIWTAVGMIVLALVNAVPFVGTLSLLIAVFFGLGAVTMHALNALRVSPSAPA